MGYGSWLWLLAIASCGYFAVKEKVFWNRQRRIEQIASPLSTAIAQMVGIAGGIYLALGVLASFLNLELPDRVRAYGIGLDPLALLSIFLSMLQPYLIRLNNFRKKWLHKR
ncbi:MAG: hypothetical protein M0Z55_11690 [Peptococcaceae bacterium]|nr:hypothetical protein [Peptococcaceae bacterium]